MSIKQHEQAFTPRQKAVLEAALGLLLKGGERALTTAGVARAARCSKESLYKWFGDREGLLAAMITFQASKVRAGTVSQARLGAEELRAHLVAFARDLLSVLASDVSLALNRLAIGNAGHADSRLGLLVLARGRRAIEQRGGALLEAGRAKGLLSFEDREEAFRTLYGLVVRDAHVRLLLGDTLNSRESDFETRAAVAVEQFLRLYASGVSPPAWRA